MNMNNPTKADLRDLLAQTADTGTRCVVMHNGDVRMIDVRTDPETGKRVRQQSGLWFFENIARLFESDKQPTWAKFWFESDAAGNGGVGPQAAQDEVHVDRLFRGLVENWAANRTGYIDFLPAYRTIDEIVAEDAR